VLVANEQTAAAVFDCIDKPSGFGLK